MEFQGSCGPIRPIQVSLGGQAELHLSRGLPRPQVSYTKKDLLIYAVGIGCDEEKFTYAQNADFQMFPTFPDPDVLT